MSLLTLLTVKKIYKLSL